ncbi:MAG: YerC/YecD family TrpR-related protein [Bacteroidota bacterium]
MKKAAAKDIDHLYGTILRIGSLEAARKFFRDLLTESEIHELAQRWKAARMLQEGKVYTRIGRETGLSSRTIARVHKWMKQGKGGYRLMLPRNAR